MRAIVVAIGAAIARSSHSEDRLQYGKKKKKRKNPLLFCPSGVVSLLWREKISFCDSYGEVAT